MAMGLASCDDSRPCLAYACFSGVTMKWTLGSAASHRVFDVRMCRDDRCEDKVVTVADDDAEACDDSSNPEGTFRGASACVVREGDGLVFSATWTYNDGLPTDETFDLRIVDRESGGVLLDQTREPQFTRQPSLDDCHDCWSAFVDLGEG